MEDGRIRTVWNVILKELRDEPIEAVTIHRSPFLTDKWYTAGATSKNVRDVEDVAHKFPQGTLDCPLPPEVVRPFFLYDEQLGRTASFTVWSESRILIHRWVGAGSHTVGGRLVRFLAVERHPGGHNHLEELFSRFRLPSS